MSQKAQHTPRPWKLCPIGAYTDFAGQSRVILGDDMRIAVVHATKGNAETKANACLIVAAPDLAEAARDALPFLRGLRDGLKAIDPQYDGTLYEIAAIKRLEAALTK